MTLEEVTYCGLYCGLCASRRRIPEQAARLRETLRREGYHQGYFDIAGLAAVFTSFWEGLNCLADTPCAGCRVGGGNPDCAIRLCAQEQGVAICPLCPDFPCERTDMLRRYPLYLADARRLQQIGPERWMIEQEVRAHTGFAYADVRLPAEVSR